MNKYLLIHEHEYGNSYYFIESEKTLDELRAIFPDFQEEADEQCQVILDKLEIDYESLRDESLSLEVIDPFVNID